MKTQTATCKEIRSLTNAAAKHAAVAEIAANTAQRVGKELTERTAILTRLRDELREYATRANIHAARAADARSNAFLHARAAFRCMLAAAICAISTALYAIITLIF